MQFLDRLSVKAKLLLIGRAFSIPLAVEVVLLVLNTDAPIAFAEAERASHQFQRPSTDDEAGFERHQPRTS